MGAIAAFEKIKRVRVLIVTAGDNRVPSTRFRILALVDLLRRQNFDFRILGARSGLIGRTLDYMFMIGFLMWSDLVLIQKRALHPGIVSIIRLSRRPLLFDVDDTVFADQPGIGFNARNKSRYENIVEHSDLCLVGNSYLAKWASSLTNHIDVIPTVINSDIWTPKSQKKHPGFYLGWIGTATNLQYLEKKLPLIEKVSRDLPNLRLIVICSRSPNNSKYGWLEFRQWQLENERQQLADIDVGLMPLDDDPWTRGKCGFKALQFMALGIPVIVSNVGVNSKIVRNGVDGFLASSDDDWMKALLTLGREPNLRLEMGNAARERIVEKYDAKIAANQLAAALRGVYERAR